MGNGVVKVFGRGEELRPFMGIIGAEDSEISFYLLIGPFRLTICLGVIRSGEANIILKNLGEFTGEGRRKLWAMVGDEDVM
jgi:hypothetical protein